MSTIEGGDYIRQLRAFIGTRPVNLIGAAGLILNHHGDLLLERKVGKEVWSVPGGICELGETLESTLQREIHEETGLLIHAAHLLEVLSQPNLYTLPNGDQFYMYTALYRVTGWSGTPRPDGQEVEELRFFPPAALPALSGPVSRRAAWLLVQQEVHP